MMVCYEHDREAERCSELAMDAFGLYLFSNCEIGEDDGEI